MREILVHWPFLEISGPQKWVVGGPFSPQAEFSGWNTAYTPKKEVPPPPPPVWGHGKLMAVILDFYLHDKIRGSPE